MWEQQSTRGSRGWRGRSPPGAREPSAREGGNVARRPGKPGNASAGARRAAQERCRSRGGRPRGARGPPRASRGWQGALPRCPGHPGTAPAGGAVAVGPDGRKLLRGIWRSVSGAERAAGPAQGERASAREAGPGKGQEPGTGGPWRATRRGRGGDRAVRCAKARRRGARGPAPPPLGAKPTSALAPPPHRHGVARNAGDAATPRFASVRAALRPRGSPSPRTDPAEPEEGLLGQGRIDARTPVGRFKCFAGEGPARPARCARAPAASHARTGVAAAEKRGPAGLADAIGSANVEGRPPG